MKPEEKPRLWPRAALGPEGQRAMFSCMGDVPHGWHLEKALPMAPAPPPPPISLKSGDRIVLDGVEHAVVPVDQVKKTPGRKPAS